MSSNLSLYFKIAKISISFISDLCHKKGKTQNICRCFLFLNVTTAFATAKGTKRPVSMVKNKITAEARQFVKQIFNDGQKTRPPVASKVVTLMKEKKNILGQPMFDKDSFLDEDQVKSLFSWGKKRALLEDEREEEDNLEEKQDEKEALVDQDLVSMTQHRTKHLVSLHFSKEDNFKVDDDLIIDLMKIVCKKTNLFQFASWWTLPKAIIFVKERCLYDVSLFCTA